MAMLPIYGKQYIRFAETFHAPARNEADSADVAVEEFTVVMPAVDGAKYAAPISHLTVTTGPHEVLGVAQYAVRTVTDGPKDNRAFSVATSGLLLVKVAAASSGETIAIGSALAVNTAGEALHTGGLVITKGGSSAIVRERITTGGTDYVLVSFN